MSSEMKMKNGYVPELRFTEFRNKSGWQRSKLGELSQVLRGGSPRPIDTYLTNDTSGLNWLKIGDVNKDSKYVTQTKEKVNHGALSKTRVVNPGDLILSNSMSFGRPYILKIKSCIHDGWIAITKISKEIKRDYLYYLISAPESQRFFTNNAAGSGVQNLNADIIKSLPVPFPDDNIEQQKIADCLSSLDKVISLQTQKIDTLQQYKKGLMQKLFPSEGETVPELRFSEFKLQGKWEKRQLGEIAKFSSGGTPSKDNPDFWNGTIPWISASSMYSTTLNKSTLNVTSLAIGNGTRIAKKGSLLILVRGSMLFNRIPMGIADIDVTFNQDVKSLSIDKKINAMFLLNQLMAFESRITINETGIGAGKIDTEELKRLNVYVPSSSEQRQVAYCLSSLDDLITAHAQELATLKMHKTGLMQQLFPSMDEVTA